MHFKMSSSICFNMDQSKILSSGNGLNFFTFLQAIGILRNSNRTCCQTLIHAFKSYPAIGKQIYCADKVQQDKDP